MKLASAVSPETEYPSYVVPTDADPFAQEARPALGGAMGRRPRLGGHRMGPVQVTVIVGIAVYLLGFLSKGYCMASGWGTQGRYMYLCYSDIPILYWARGIASGVFPYVGELSPGQEALEYPVLIGIFMYLTGLLTRAMHGDGLEFFVVNVVLMAGFFALTVVATGRTVLRRPWDALMVAASPMVFLASFINWDLLAVGLTSAALWAWARRRPLLAGALLGLAISAKFYPLVLVGPFFLLCVLRRQIRALVLLLAGTLGAWALVNVPIMIANFDGWVRFYSFSRTRGQDFGSIWYAVTVAGWTVPSEALNTVAMGVLGLLCLGIAALTLQAPRPPRLSQLCFLTVAAFVLTNKVYSPQYVLWVLPLAVLARPRWRDLIIWQVGQVMYFVAIWWFLVGYGTNDKGLPVGWYAAAIAAHILGTLWLASVVARDILFPEHDPVRSDGIPDNCDDPGGGVLDGSPSLLRRQNVDRGDPGRRAGPSNDSQIWEPALDDADAPAQTARMREAAGVAPR